MSLSHNHVDYCLQVRLITNVDLELHATLKMKKKIVASVKFHSS